MFEVFEYARKVSSIDSQVSSIEPSHLTLSQVSVLLVCLTFLCFIYGALYYLKLHYICIYLCVKKHNLLRTSQKMFFLPSFSKHTLVYFLTLPFTFLC